MEGQPISVIGAGNWLVSHDRIGPRVLALVEGRYGPDVELCDIGSGGLAILDHLHGQDLLLVVDAKVGGTPGEVVVVIPDLDTPPTSEASVHQIGPVEALCVAKHLFPEKMPRRVLLVLVDTTDIDTEQEEEACRQVVTILDSEIAAAAPHVTADLPPSGGRRRRECN